MRQSTDIYVVGNARIEGLTTDLNMSMLPQSDKWVKTEPM